MSTLGTLTLSASALSIPEYGSARCDALLEAGAAPATGPATLTIAGYPMAGCITSADLDAPDLPHAVWANGAAWDLPLPASLPPRGYQTDAGVKLSTVLADLLADVNATGAAVGYPAEAYAALPVDVPIEHGYLRPVGTTGRAVLATLRRMGLVGPWWIDAAGALNFGPRPSGPSSGRADIMRRNAGVGLRVIGVDSPAGFLPGTTVEGVTTRRLVVRERAKSLTIEAWATNIASIRDTVAAIAERDHPEARYAYPRTFVVRAVGGDGRMDLTPPADAPDLVPLNKVEQWTMGSALTFPAVGTSVLVAFRDARESRPCVIGIAPSAPGAAAARVGDTAGMYYQDTATGLVYYAPTSAGVYAPVVSGVGPPPPATPGTSVTIATGSSRVKVSS